MTQNCYAVVTDGVTCIHCDPVIGVTGVPEQTFSEPIYGWNASARSSLSQAGNCYVEFDSPYSTGVVIGFATEYDTTHPKTVLYGFYLFENNGAFWYQRSESGVLIGSPVRRVSEADVFRIERSGTKIVYFFNNVRIGAVDTTVQTPVYIVACLYASNDGVG